MLAPGITGALIFDKAKIMAFFKMIDKMFATYDITRNQKKK